MTKTATLMLAVVALLLVLAFVTGFAAFVSGPPVLECGGLDREVCERAMDQAAQDPYDQAGGDVVYEGTGPGFAYGPVTYFRIEPYRPGAECGDWTLEKYRLAIGPLAFSKQVWHSNPRGLC
jgi:hypothetical protein